MNVRKDILILNISAVSNNIYLTCKTIMRITVCTLLCSASTKCYQNPCSIFHPQADVYFHAIPGSQVGNEYLGCAHGKAKSAETNTDIILFRLRSNTENVMFYEDRYIK